MESSTKILRRLLDERGVEWWPLDGTPDMTECIVDGVRHKYRPVGGGIIWSSCTEVAVKPEQAIAATLGAGTCHDKGNIERFICSECGCRLDLQDDDREATMWLDDGAATVPRFCPNCGRKVVDE